MAKAIILLSISILLLIGTFKILSNQEEVTTKFSYEIENIIEQGIEYPIDEQFFESLGIDFEKRQYLLLFTSGASTCSNCFNEIVDYLSFTENSDHTFSTFLLYHGSDSLSSTRFVLASNLLDAFDGSRFLKTTDFLNHPVSQILPEYPDQTLLFLIDVKKPQIFHAFVLPINQITRFSKKEIAFQNAIKANKLK